MEDSSTRERFHLAAVVLAALLTLAFLWLVPPGPSGWTGLGRLHPMLVHFPIALLVLGGLLHLFGSARHRQLQETARVLWVVGLWSALPASLAGQLLSESGTYDPEMVARHRLAATGLILAGVAGIWLRTGLGRDRIRRFSSVPLLVLAGLTGHFGGALTHGPDYLLEWGSRSRRAAEERELGNLPVYSGIVQPILAAHCVDCHGSARAEGGLRLQSYHAILEGGSQGPVLAPGKPDGSALYRRVTLPPTDDDHMPPAGRRPLEVGETELLRWWIELGASPELTVATVRPDQMPSSVRTALVRMGRLGPADPLAGLEPAQDLPEGIVQSLRRQGILIRRVVEHRPFVEVDLSERPLAAADLEPLAPIARNVIALNLSGCRLDPDAWKWIGRLTNLQRLRLERSNVGSADLESLAGLGHLSYLNLYGTRVTDEGLSHLVGLNRLTSLYLWGTEVTEQGVRELTAHLPRLEVNTGL